VSAPAPRAEPGSVTVLGSANLDLVARVARMPRPGETLLGHEYHEFAGGKGLNQAVAASRSGAPTSFIGAVGGDAAGQRLREVLRSDAIDADRVPTVDAPTGRALIVVDDDGENMIVVVPGANALVRPLVDVTARVVLAQLEVPIAVVAASLAAARRAGAITVLNPAPAAELPAELLDVCDVIIPNEHELALLGGVERLLAAGCGTVVVTRGGEGIDVHTADDTWHQAPFEVTVVDTTGAGDACCGGIAARLAAGDTLRDAVRWGAAAGAIATTRAGAVPAQPSAAEIDALIA
jgi:ribokinase